MGLSIAERVEKYGKIYVQNMTTDPKAVVVINFRVSGRPPYELKIPPGPYPYEIYPSRLPKNALLEGSDELSRFLERGILRVVPGKIAREILKDPEVKAEVSALIGRVNSDVEQKRYATQLRKDAEAASPDNPVDAGNMVRGPGGPPKVAQADNPLQRALDQARATTNAPSFSAYQLTTAGAGSDVSAKVLGIMASYFPQRDQATVKSLKAIASQVTHADLSFILSRALEGSLVHAWATERMTRTRK